ncbi:hypothetical protein BJ944DRAFT_246663 [Cunninghamella echinulata]|nr:hypothetical protein BJ944DRAFT_246663 [Cunninghamella echinulata]
MKQSHQFFLDYYHSKYCQHNKSDDKLLFSRHLITDHLDHIFDNIIKPTFPTQSQQLQKKKNFKIVKQYNDEPIQLKEEWKEMNHGFNTIDIIEWIIETCNTNQLESILSKLIPPVLRILDDYSIENKNRAVILVHNMISKLDSDVIIKFGLENVFIDALFYCLKYLSDDRDLPLLQSTYSCLIDLVAKTKPAGSKERCMLFDKMMTDGIILGLTYAGHKSSFLKVFLQTIDKLIPELGALTIQYLKVIIFAIDNGLQLLNIEINHLSLTLLEHTIQKAWPRIPFHGPTILKGLVTAWLNNCDKPDIESQELCNHIKTVYQSLYYLCHEKIEPDIQALLNYNHSLSLLLNNK